MSATLMRGVLDQINTQSQQIAGMSRNQPAALKTRRRSLTFYSTVSMKLMKLRLTRKK